MPSDFAKQNVDLEIIESGYRFVSDDSAFDDCLSAWSKKISALESQLNKPQLEDDGFIQAYMAGLTGVIQRLSTPQALNPIDEAVREVDAAAMVIAPNNIVVSANSEAFDRFDAVQGRLNKLDWLDPNSVAEFNQVRAYAQASRTSQQAVIRTRGKHDEIGIAEVYTLKTKSGDQHFIAIRALETHWSASVDTTLETTFQLTQAERQIARALYETRDTAEIAMLRNTTGQTIRTQIRTILRKTETKSQVDLIRLIGLLNARASHARRSAPTQWLDPWQNYTILKRPCGSRLAYTWTGKENGIPALLVHGCVQGYLLGDGVEQALYDAGIQLFAVVRPGFADSDCAAEADYMAEQVAAIKWFLTEHKLSNIPAVGIGNGAASLFHLAKLHPGKISRLLVTGLLEPYNEVSLAALTPAQKAMTQLLRHVPKLSEVLSRICVHFIHQKGVDWYLEKGWSDVPEVQKTLADPNILPLIRSACSLTLTSNTFNYVREMKTKWTMEPGLAAQVPCLVHHMHGEFDRSVSSEEAQAIAKASNNFTTECVPDAGYFLIYEKPDLFTDRLIHTILG